MWFAQSRPQCDIFLAMKFKLLGMKHKPYPQLATWLSGDISHRTARFRLFTAFPSPYPQIIPNLYTFYQYIGGTKSKDTISWRVDRESHKVSLQTEGGQNGHHKPIYQSSETIAGWLIVIDYARAGAPSGISLSAEKRKTKQHQNLYWGTPPTNTNSKQQLGKAASKNNWQLNRQTNGPIKRQVNSQINWQSV